MKKLLIIVITGLILPFVLAERCYSQNNSSEGLTQLANIQEKIIAAYSTTMKNGSPEALLEIEKNIKKISSQSYIKNYWLAYTELWIANYYKEADDNAKSEESINNAILSLEAISNQNSETLALLAYTQSFAIQFSRGMQAGVMSQKASTNAAKARNMDTKNLRAWYVSGLLDLYTPKAYGGQTNCEEYFITATKLNEQNTSNPYLPTWGKDDSYLLLINYYITKGDKNKAKHYFYEAEKLHPNNPAISKLTQHFTE